MPLLSTRAGVAESYPAAGASDSGVKAHVSHVSACVCVCARACEFSMSLSFQPVAAVSGFRV